MTTQMQYDVIDTPFPNPVGNITNTSLFCKKKKHNGFLLFCFQWLIAHIQCYFIDHCFQLHFSKRDVMKWVYKRNIMYHDVLQSDWGTAFHAPGTN